MRTYFQILLWTIAFQGILFVGFPAGCVIPHGLLAFPFAPCVGVSFAAIRFFSFWGVAGLVALTYVMAFGIRIAGCFTPWAANDPGLAAVIVLVPIAMAALIHRCKHGVAADV